MKILLTSLREIRFALVLAAAGEMSLRSQIIRCEELLVLDEVVATWLYFTIDTIAIFKLFILNILQVMHKNSIIHSTTLAVVHTISKNFKIYSGIQNIRT